MKEFIRECIIRFEHIVVRHSLNYYHPLIKDWYGCFRIPSVPSPPWYPWNRKLMIYIDIGINNVALSYSFIVIVHTKLVTKHLYWQIYEIWTFRFALAIIVDLKVTMCADRHLWFSGDTFVQNRCKFLQCFCLVEDTLSSDLYRAGICRRVTSLINYISLLIISYAADIAFTCLHLFEKGHINIANLIYTLSNELTL